MDIFSSDIFTHFITFIANSDLNIITGLLWVLVAIIFSMIGGAIGGMLLAGKHLGYDLSAIIGGLFGPAGGIPAVLLGLLVLNYLLNF